VHKELAEGDIKDGGGKSLKKHANSLFGSASHVGPEAKKKKEKKIQ